MPRVLVLVAEQNVRELRRLILAGAGFEVVSPEMNAALCVVEAEPFDALVVSGVEEADAGRLIAAFRRHNPNSRVIAVGTRDRLRSLADATVDPYDPSSLVGTLRALSGTSAPPS